ncbi:hypothetical protein EGJ86_19165 [Pseudomonas sp. o96-267]|uniref:hypothetical protein n=1 Tax=Pseudomonas sp. o96-267 TaxID=2479853 RepID=UPI000F7B3E28|nr:MULTISPECIES: hypothetical protein [Pseudomonas]MDH0959111.1 hypothetical protein [Pseudomonas chengduensis]MDV5863581.1 hypothetical protein [Pseudomonas mendocina]RRV31694.1 hypothetical protein EGJ86_19165 [Pseudomonas sp. o96-267]
MQHDDLANSLDECSGLIGQAKISQGTRNHLLSQASIYALFLSDLSSGRLTPDRSHGNAVNSMLELISEFCSQVRTALNTHQAE